ncbi:MAG TPA: tripartite tricarboxylate transporter substrate binding protein [Burkholderiales bacterium]|nr:tripartite tricarboxylate transporter substrate binding protein [Burkholderiales bacterium]
MQFFRRVLLLFVLGFALAANAQVYPVKPVRIIVGFAPGGSVDIVARLIAQKLGETLGQPFVVENKPGATGFIAAEYVAKSAPDGYTLLMGATGLTAGVSIYAKLPFDLLHDFAPVAHIANQANVLIVNPTLPAKSVADFISVAKSRPGKLNYGSTGTGSSLHMAAEMFSMMTGASMVHVPYKGSAPALTDLAGGQLDAMFENVPTAIPFIQSGKVRALAVTSTQRSAMLPDIPTMQDAGLSGYDFHGWLGVLAPAGTPKEVVAKLNAEIDRAIKGDLNKKLLDLGLDVVSGTPEQFASYMRQDIDTYAKIVKAAGITPQ